MANSTFPAVAGGMNGGNARIANLLDTDQMGYAMSPELVFSQVVTYRDLQAATGVLQVDELEVGATVPFGTYTLELSDARTGASIGEVSTVVHEDTITIGGTASDGDYDALFVTLDPPVRARVRRSTTPATNDNIATELAAAITDLVATDLAGIVVSASALSSVVTIVYAADIAPQNLTCTETTATGTITPSSSSDADTVAAALEAELEAARATFLADYLDDESVTTDTITLEYVEGVEVLLTADFPATATGTVTTESVATIPIGSTGNLFPANVWVEGDRGVGMNVTVAFAGITTIAATLGDAGSVDGLMESGNLAAEGFASTIGAAEYAPHMEIAFVPIATITVDEPFANLTAGEVEFLIPYSPPPTI